MIEGGAAGAAAAAPDPAAADPATAGAALASFEATVTGPALCAQPPAPNAATVSAVKNTVFAFNLVAVDKTTHRFPIEFIALSF
jgi:hypothetical protein